MNFQALKVARTAKSTGTSQLYLEPPPAKSLASASRVSVTPVAGGSFLQFDYDWTYEGETQTGVLLLGADEDDAASAAWIDSFHMSSQIMSCTGAAATSAAELLGTHEAPPGPHRCHACPDRFVRAERMCRAASPQRSRSVHGPRRLQLLCAPRHRSGPDDAAPPGPLCAPWPPPAL